MSSSSSEVLAIVRHITTIYFQHSAAKLENERQLDIYVSDDAVHWEALAMGIYKLANSLLRDPSITLHSGGFITSAIRLTGTVMTLLSSAVKTSSIEIR